MLAICVCSALMAGILSLFAVVANGVLLFVMYKDPLCCFRRPITVFIAVLAVNDFLTGSVISAIEIRNEILCTSTVELPRRTGNFEAIISLFAINNGTLLIVGLSVERLIAVALPFYYRARASVKKTLTCVVCIVLYSLIFCLLQLSDIPEGIYFNLQLHLNLSLPLVAVLIFNFALLRVLRKYHVRRRGCSLSSDASDSYLQSDQGRFDIDKQFAFTAILIVLFLLLSHLPYFIMSLIELYCSQCIHSESFLAFRRISLPFLFISSACNPFIYTFRISQCRRSFQIVFCKWQAGIEVSPTKRARTVSTVPNPVVLRKVSEFHFTNGVLEQTTFDESLPKNIGIDNPQEVLDIEYDALNRLTPRKCSNFYLENNGLAETTVTEGSEESVNHELGEPTIHEHLPEDIGIDNPMEVSDGESDVFDTRL